MPNIIIPRARKRKPASSTLPIIDYIDRMRVNALPPGPKRLARDYGFSPSMAMVIAQAAGFNVGDDR